MLTAPIQLLSAPFQLPGGEGEMRGRPSCTRMHIAYVYGSSRYRGLELHVTASMATSDSSQLSLRRFFSPSSSASVGTMATESKSDEELSESTVDKQPSEHYGRIERRSRARYCHGRNCGQECIFLHYICEHQVFHPPPFILMLAKTLVRRTGYIFGSQLVTPSEMRIPL